MENNLDATMKRTLRYRYNDGLAELTVGVLCFIGAILIAITYEVVSLTNGLLYLAIAAALIIFAAMFGGWGAVTIFERLRDQIVHLRTGYVQYPIDKQTNKRFANVIMWLSLGLALLYAILKIDMNTHYYLLIGPMLGFVLAYNGGRTGISRLYIEAVVAVLLAFGLPILLLIIDDENAEILNIIYLLVVGVALFIIGGFALRTYMRQTQGLDTEA